MESVELRAIHRPVTIELSRSAVENNVKVIKNNAKMDSVMAVLKANAFGHGLAEMAELAIDAGCDRFGVALLDEAIALRKLGYRQAIDVLGLTPVEHVQLAAQYKITIALTNLEWLKLAAAMLHEEGMKLQVSLPIDTGLNRVGIKDRDEILQIIDFLNNDPHAKEHLIWESMWTHFATADTPNVDYIDFQIKNWQELTADLKYQPKEMHFLNSGMATWYPEKIKGDTLRLGTVLFGIDSSEPKMAFPYDMQQVLELKASAVYVKKINKGESVGYGASWQAPNDGYLATLPIGHSDGLAKECNGWSVLDENGNVVGKFVGGLAMDQSMIWLDQNEVKIGAELTIIGREKNTISEMSEYANVDPINLVTRLSPRINRVIVK